MFGPMLAPFRAAQAQATTSGGLDMVFVLGVAGVALTLLAVAAVGLLRWWRARNRSYYDDSAPPLITIPSSAGLRPISPSLGRREPTPPAGQGSVPQPRAYAPPPPPATVGHAGAAYAPSGGGNGSATTHGEVVEGSTIRFYRPPEGTLQLLPGRLEIVAGEEIPHDIRFIRARGEDAEVTFGRSEGPPHRHVQLHARTVSRQHARMRFAERRWLIENLSETNPVVINGRELDSVDGGYALKEGDRIEMGEVVFLFRER